ncbi:tetratricopeptide repeat protein [uncultured Flavobacterium sp.]|uniref:tetratricopeptide repeat protein n=1 Tax=uncultured Flavobacterium sp. TaxID=165435 RepID=UPI0025FDE669|nr:tetratricopeptide repeat protein [uncultured Flavobacterium sp.]
MKNFKFLGLSLLVFGVASAQDANEAKKAIDAEQYQKAKTTLKSLVASSPDEGKNYFLLGDVYMKQKEQDSAAIYFNKGKAVKNDAEYNTIGLGHIDLDNNNAAAAQAKFDAVEKELRRKDVEQLIYIGRAYISSDNPDYKKAIEVLKKAIAKDSKSAQAYLSLGDAYYRDRNQNEAYSSYRTALSLDNTLLRAKLQIGTITKNTRAAFPEAIKAFDEIVKSNPNYGPVYRELAETYYLWANTEGGKYAEYTKKALEYYEKYMSLTDYSLNSRMRHADFLVLTRDWKALEAEAAAMQKLDRVNPKILRYLAYSAYENGNYAGSLSAMKEFLAKAEQKRIIGRDYLYLGLAKMATTVGKDDKDNNIITDQVMFDEAITDIKKAVELDPTLIGEYNEIGKKLFGQKLYGPASVVFEIGAGMPDNKNLFYDNFYLGYAIYYDHLNMSEEAQKTNTTQLQKGAAAMDKVIELSATSQDAYLFKARLNQRMATNESYAEMAKAYDGYIKVVTEKGAEETSKDNVKKYLVEAYSNAGAYYAVTEKAKAIDYFTKALAIDPTDEYAKSELAKLKK